MNIKIYAAILAFFFILQQPLRGGIMLSIPSETLVIQMHEENVFIQGNDRDWGGKFKIIEKRNVKNNLAVNYISCSEGELTFNLTIQLSNFNESIKTNLQVEDSESSDFLDDIIKLYDIPIQADFRGEMTLYESSLDEYYFLYDVGLNFYFRTIFILIGKELEVGKTFEQECILRPDDIVDALRDKDGNLPLEFNDQLCEWDSEEDLDDVEPILLIKYTITHITDYAVFADISGRLITPTPSPSMKPSFTINGKGVWQRANPLVNEISFDFNYSEKRAHSTMHLKGYRQTKSYLP